jgi:hypothetical protein
MPENNDIDDDFYERADAVIAVANAQCAGIGRGKISASTLYGAARFNAWVTACKYDSAAAMQADKAEAVDYFVAQYRAMFEDHFDDYVAHFAKYMQRSAD